MTDYSHIFLIAVASAGDRIVDIMHFDNSAVSKKPQEVFQDSPCYFDTGLVHETQLLCEILDDAEV